MSASLVGSEMCIRDRGSSSEEPDWGGSESEEESVYAPEVTRTVKMETVSYTHLTLPTICSV
eukprot:5195026-Alexandrium_andersonii.AAC.1